MTAEAEVILAHGVSVRYEGPPRSFRQMYEDELRCHRMQAEDAIMEARRIATQRDTLLWLCAALAVTLIVVALGGLR